MNHIVTASHLSDLSILFKFINSSYGGASLYAGMILAAPATAFLRRGLIIDLIS
jgi:hypothetical protein